MRLQVWAETLITRQRGARDLALVNAASTIMERSEEIRLPSEQKSCSEGCTVVASIRFEVFDPVFAPRVRCHVHPPPAVQVNFSQNADTR